MDWRSAPWRRWLGCVALFALVTGACGQATRFLPAEISPLVSLLFLAISIIAAFQVGARIRTQWWVAVAPVIVLLLGTPLLIIPPNAVLTLVPNEAIFDGLDYAETMFVAAIIMLMASGLLLALYALVARAGVRWGERQSMNVVPESMRSDRNTVRRTV